MVVILLIIIASCLLFGKEETKGCLSGIGEVLFILLIIASISSSC